MAKSAVPRRTRARSLAYWIYDVQTGGHPFMSNDSPLFHSKWHSSVLFRKQCNSIKNPHFHLLKVKKYFYDFVSLLMFLK